MLSFSEGRAFMPGRIRGQSEKSVPRRGSHWKMMNRIRDEYIYLFLIRFFLSAKRRGKYGFSKGKN